MIRRPPRRATTDPVVTPVGHPGGSVPGFGGPQGAGRALASRGSVGMLLLAPILPGWLSQGMSPARDGDNSARSTLYPQRWARGSRNSPAGRGPCGAPHPPEGPPPARRGEEGRAGSAQGGLGTTPEPAEPQDGGKASNPAEGSARRGPLWIRNFVMASDPRERGCPLPSVSPARPGTLGGGGGGEGDGQGGLRGSAGGSERFY